MQTSLDVLCSYLLDLANKNTYYVRILECTQACEFSSSCICSLKKILSAYLVPSTFLCLGNAAGNKTNILALWIFPGNLKKSQGGARVVQPVKPLTLDFDSGRDLGIEPRSGRGCPCSVVSQLGFSLCPSPSLCRCELSQASSVK